MSSLYEDLGSYFFRFLIQQHCHYHLQCFLFFYASYLKLHMSIFANNLLFSETPFLFPNSSIFFTSQSVNLSSSFCSCLRQWISYFFIIFYCTELSDEYFVYNTIIKKSVHQLLINNFSLEKHEYFLWHAKCVTPSQTFSADHALSMLFLSFFYSRPGFIRYIN